MARLLVFCLVLILSAAGSAQATPIDPVIGVRGGDASTNISDAVEGGEPLDPVPCTAEDLAGALCWEFFNDTGEFIIAFSGFFDNPECDGTSGDFDCLLSLHEDSEFETLNTFPEEGFGLQEFRFSNGIIPPAPLIEIDSIELLALLSTPHFIVYGFGFAAGTTLTITSIETVSSIPEPATLGLFLLGLGAAVHGARRRRIAGRSS